MRYLLTLTLLLACAGPAVAQTTVPEPRKTILVDDPVDAVPALGSQWLWVYNATAPAPLPNTPFITLVRITLTPTSGTGTRVITVPRAQVVRETTAARCTGGSTPCLRIDDVALPVGAFTVRASLVSGDGLEGGPTPAIPFSGSYPPPAALTGPRILP